MTSATDQIEDDAPSAVWCVRVVWCVFCACVCVVSFPFGHVERTKSGDDWVSVCRNVVVVIGVRFAGRGIKAWRECVKDDMDELGLHSECMGRLSVQWRSLISGKTSNPS